MSATAPGSTTHSVAPFAKAPDADTTDYLCVAARIAYIAANAAYYAALLIFDAAPTPVNAAGVAIAAAFAVAAGLALHGSCPGGM